MPNVALAYGRVAHVVCAVVHCQVQGVHTGATFGIGVVIGVGACCSVGRIVPSVALAYNSVAHVVCAVVHCQVQGIHAGATIGIGVVICVGACSSVCRIMPSVALAYNSVAHIVCTVVHCQVQGVHAGATIGIGVVICVGACSSVCRIMPSVALAYNSVAHIVCTVVHCQVQGVHAGATIGIGVVICVGACSSVCRIMPSVALAYNSVAHIVCTIVHRQVQGHDGVAAIGGSSCIGIGRGYGAGIVCHTVNPGQAVACGIFVYTCAHRIHLHCHHHNTIYPIGKRQHGSINKCHRHRELFFSLIIKGHPIPYKRQIIATYHTVGRNSHIIQHIQIDMDNTVAAMRIRMKQSLRINTCRIIFYFIEGKRKCIVANCRINIIHRYGHVNKCQVHHTVASANRRQMNLMCARRRNQSIVILVRQLILTQHNRIKHLIGWQNHNG